MLSLGKAALKDLSGYETLAASDLKPLLQSKATQKKYTKSSQKCHDTRGGCHDTSLLCNSHREEVS